MLNWNFERWRTRDRLLEEMRPFPFTPQQLSAQIYDIAQLNGYVGSLNEFWTMVNQDRIITGTLYTFPQEGNEGTLYLDTETSKLYYYKSSSGYELVASTVQ